MLTVKSFKSAGSTQKYFSAGDYYGNDSERVGQWHGTLAQELGLSGSFDSKESKEFKNLLKGVLPDGTAFAVSKERRVGTDFCFTVPKSVSIESLVHATKTEKEKIEKAAITAAKETLAQMAKEGFFVIRKGAGGKHQTVTTNQVFAIFKHISNREQEPNLHQHCFLINVSKDKDGKYRAVDTPLNKLKQIKTYGQVFRNRLALKIKELGYDIRITSLDKNGNSFELAKYSDIEIKAHSIRRRTIEKYAKERGITYNQAAILTKPNKQVSSTVELKDKWKETSKESIRDVVETKSLELKEISPLKQLTNKVREWLQQKEEALQVNSPLSAIDLVKTCILDISDKESVFLSSKLIASSNKFAIGIYSPEQINEAVASLEKTGELISCYRNEKYLSTKHLNIKSLDIKHFTTKELLNKERDNLRIVREGKNKRVAILKTKHSFKIGIARFEANAGFNLNPVQVKAVEFVLFNKDKVLAIKGLPGTGKTTVLDCIRHISQKQVIHLGTAPTASAARGLEETANIKSSTLHAFCHKFKGYLEGRGSTSLAKVKAEYKQVIMFVDEAGLVGTRIFNSLLNLSQKLGFRIVLVGDEKQLTPVDAGIPFTQTLEKINSIELNKIMRQKDKTELKAVEEAVKGDIYKSIELLKKNITYVTTPKEINNATLDYKLKNYPTAKAVDHYLTLSEKVREKTLILTQLRADRALANKMIFKALKVEGKLGSRGMTGFALEKAPIEKAGMTLASTYQNIDKLCFLSNYKRHNIKAGDTLNLSSVDRTANAIWLERENGKLFRFVLNPKINYQTKFNTYKETTIELRENGLYRATKNLKDLGIVNSETFKIKELNIEKKQITLKFKDKREITVPASSLKHIDYGYAATLYASQGKTAANVIGIIPNAEILNNSKAWLVLVSRQKESLKIFSGLDKGELAKQMGQSGDKATAISAVGTISIDKAENKETIDKRD